MSNEELIRKLLARPGRPHRDPSAEISDYLEIKARRDAGKSWRELENTEINGQHLSKGGLERRFRAGEKQHKALVSFFRSAVKSAEAIRKSAKSVFMGTGIKKTLTAIKKTPRK